MIRSLILALLFFNLAAPVSRGDDAVQTEINQIRTCFSTIKKTVMAQDKIQRKAKELAVLLKTKPKRFKYAWAVNLTHIYYRRFISLQENLLRLCKTGELSEGLHFSKRNAYADLEIESLVVKDIAWTVWYRGIKVVNSVYYNSKKLRRIIQERAKQSNLKTFVVFRVQKKLFSKKVRERLLRRVHFGIRIKEKIDKGLIKSRPLMVSLFNYYLERGLTFVLSKDYSDRARSRYSVKVFKDRLYLLRKKVVDSFNRSFGNAAGSVKTREGYLYLNEKVKKVVNNTLRPFDIIFEKTPFILTDKTIPGHFGHVAIYLGTKEELIEQGLWDDRKLEEYRDKIELGYNVIEADREGVHFKKLVDFLNVDEFLILRTNFDRFSLPLKKKTLRRALSKVGLEYDFNFDIESISKVVCSELIFFSFPDIPWETEQILGRQTISPDNLVNISFKRPDLLKFIIFIKGSRSGYSLLSEDKLKQLILNP